MFPSVLISADNDRHGYLKSFVLETGYVMLVREVTHYPAGSDLSRMLSTTSAELIFLDTRDGEAAATLLDQMRQRWPDVAVIGIGVPSAGRPLSLDAVVSYPPGVEELQVAIDDSLHRVKGTVEEHLIAFLPAKAGSGATTLLLNTASDLARKHGKKVLVMEADLRSGVLSVMLNAEPQHSIQEALRVAGELNEGQLAHLVAQAHGVDYLLTSRNPRLALPIWSQYFQLLNFVRSRYDLILVDLPELVNPATREIVRRARQVFTVTTSEVLSLKLAELRAQELLGWGVEEARIQILLNRWSKSDLAPKDVEKYLNRSIHTVFPNDYPAVRRATIAGAPFDGESEIGRAVSEFSAGLIGAGKPQPGGVTAKLKSLLKRS